MNYHCPVCSRPSAAYMQPCDRCGDEILNHSDTPCSLCGNDLAGCDDPCPACRTDIPQIDEMNTIGPWTGPLREWLSALKYGGDTRMADWLSEILAEIWSENWSGVHLVPVPPRPARIFRSGIDPVGLLALGMRKRGIPVNRLLRRRGNRTQKNLSRRERLEEGALKYEIRLNARINQKEYVLLDDVSTTGTTLNVCARILKSAGAERVYGLVVCKD